MGVGFPKGGKFTTYHRRVVDYLQDKHGLRLVPTDDQEACGANFGPSLINRYVFGKGRVIIAGQAAGFFNMIAEGMSCALHSGAIAGEAAVEAFRRDKRMQDVYRAMIASEVRRCSDQWNPFKIAFGRPHEAEFRGAMKRHCLKNKVKIVRDILAFCRLYSPMKWGRQILWQAICRHFRGGYSPSRWL